MKKRDTLPPASYLSFETLLDYVEGRLSPAEKRKVETWLEAHPTDRQALEGIRLFLAQEPGGRKELEQYLDEQDHGFDHLLVRHKRNKVVRMGRYLAAASILIAAIMLGLFWEKDPQSVQVASEEVPAQPETPLISLETLSTPRKEDGKGKPYHEYPLPQFSEAVQPVAPSNPADTSAGNEEIPEPTPLPQARPLVPAPDLGDFRPNVVPESIEKVVPARVAASASFQMQNQLDQLHAAGNFSPEQDAVLLKFSGRHAVLAIRGSTERIYFPHNRRIRSAVTSPDGKYLLTASDDRTARLWSRSGQQLASFSHRKAVFSAIFSPDGKSILTTADDNGAHLWSLGGELLADFSHKRPVFSATFSPDGQRVLTASDDNTARLWDRAGTLLTTFTHERSVFSAVFSPNGTQVLTASDDNTARLWDLGGHQLALLPHNRSVRSAVFSPDGQRLLTASWDKTARLWDLTGKMHIEFRHSSWVYAATFSPDGQKILTTGDERAAHLWDTTGAHLAKLEHDELVTSAVFSPDGQRILTSSRDQVSRFWTLGGDSLGEIACPC